MKTFLPTLVTLAAAVSAQNPSPLAKLANDVAPSVVTVRVVADLQMPAMMGGEKQEMKQETFGIVVDKSGIVLVPTNALDPSARMSMFFGDEGEMSSTISSLKVVIGNEAKELVATVVAKDEKLGFSYVRIGDLGDRQLQPLSFAQGSEVDIGATVWAVGRLAEAYDFAPFLARNHVVGRIKKPRSAFLLDGNLEIATPVFTAEGALCGVVAKVDVGGQNQDRESMMMSMFSGGGFGGSHTFVVTAQVAANSIAQALEAAAKAPAKADEKKDAGK